MVHRTFAFSDRHSTIVVHPSYQFKLAAFEASTLPPLGSGIGGAKNALAFTDRFLFGHFEFSLDV